MILELKKTSNLEQSWAGIEALKLFNVRTQGLNVIDTVLASNALFKVFLETGSVADEHLLRIIELFGQDRLAGQTDLYVRCSLPTEYAGLQSGFKTRPEITDLKFWIEKIYRSWSGDKARYFRVTKSIPDSESFPAILIQPFLDNIATLCTRAPKTGDFTDSNSWELNIHNTVKTFSPELGRWLQQIENAIKKPCKVHFEYSKDRPICSISDQVMSEEASLRLLHEHLQAGLIDELEYLARIEPRKLVIFEGHHWRDDPTAQGLPASPGKVHGRMVFRTSDWRHMRSADLISVADEYHAEDIELLLACQGAVSARGGKTSHGAVVCRGIGKPAVAGVEAMQVDDRTRTVRIGVSVYDEGTWLVVDGDEGSIRFTEHPVQFPQYRLNSNVGPYVYRILRALDSFDQTAFPNLPSRLLNHLGDLRRALRKVGVVK